MSFRIYRLPAVLERTGLSRSTLYVMIEVGTFPAPVPLGARAVGWTESDLVSWLDGRKALRGGCEG